MGSKGDNRTLSRPGAAEERRTSWSLEAGPALWRDKPTRASFEWIGISRGPVGIVEGPGGRIDDGVTEGAWWIPEQVKYGFRDCTCRRSKQYPLCEHRPSVPQGTPKDSRPAAGHGVATSGARAGQQGDKVRGEAVSTSTSRALIPNTTRGPDFVVSGARDPRRHRCATLFVDRVGPRMCILPFRDVFAVDRTPTQRARGAHPSPFQRLGDPDSAGVPGPAAPRISRRRRNFCPNRGARRLEVRNEPSDHRLTEASASARHVVEITRVGRVEGRRGSIKVRQYIGGFLSCTRLPRPPAVFNRRTRMGRRTRCLGLSDSNLGK